MDSNRKKRITLYVAVLLVIAGVIAVLVISTLDGNKKKKPALSVETTEVDAAASESSANDTGRRLSAKVMLEELDLDSGRMTFLNIEDGEEIAVSFGGGADIRNRHDRVISATVLKTGYFADITYDPDTMTLKALKGMNDAWEYKGVMNLVIDDSLKKMTVSDTIYRYDDRLRVLSNGEFRSLSELDENDIFDLVGIDNYVYLLVVASGHGYLELSGAEDFIDGVLSVGRNRQFLITEGMRLTLPEGKYNVAAVHDEYEGAAEIRIGRDSTTTLDLTPFSSASIERGEVSFNIEPFGTDLYIDGVRTSYDKPVQLPYGYHAIVAELGGYTAYEGSIDVGGSRQTCNISLSPSPVRELGGPDDITEDYVPGDDYEGSDYQGSSDGLVDSTSDSGEEDPEAEGDNGSFPSDSETGFSGDSYEDLPSQTPTPTETPRDEDYSIRIKCTEGTEVYLNDTYAGKITGGVLTVPKQVGELAIRLELDGYTTRYYTVFVESGNEDTEFSFPGMVKEG